MEVETTPPQEINTAFFLRIACGQLGLKAHEFYRYRASHFFQHLKGHNDARKANQEFQFLMIRQQTKLLFDVQIEEKFRTNDIEAFWPSPWAKHEELEEIDEQENTAKNKKMVDAFNEHFNKKENAPKGTPKAE